MWYLPYIFTDSQQTVSTGREVYGYPKQLGVYDPAFPAALGDAGGVTTVSGLAIDPYAPTTLAIQREMISVARKPGGATLFGAPSLIGQLGSFFGGVSVNASLPSGPGSAPKLRDHAVGQPAAARCAAACNLGQGHPERDRRQGGRAGRERPRRRHGHEHDARLPQAVPRCQLHDQGLLPGGDRGADHVPSRRCELRVLDPDSVRGDRPELGERSDRGRSSASRRRRR